ncbi:prepilin-type N-terminal cleavage/methylation domain-containing protein [Tissierella carlieri]|nr:prepilin-type N-terminal cleavage/methylation domain-containing protein [Tissierella carlieri]
MDMWSTIHIYHKNRGFTLIEIILSLAICSLIIIPIFSILDISIEACTIGDEKDQLMMNGRYAIEYIKGDIRAADKIISSDKIKDLKKKFPTNIGFIIMIIEEEKSKNIYRYITYHRKNDKLVRMACSRVDDKYPLYTHFDGNNDLCEFVDNIEDTKFDTENSIIYLDLKFKHNYEKLDLKSDIYIRCPIDY